MAAAGQQLAAQNIEPEELLAQRMPQGPLAQFTGTRIKDSGHSHQAVNSKGSTVVCRPTMKASATSLIGDRSTSDSRRRTSSAIRAYRTGYSPMTVDSPPAYSPSISSRLPPMRNDRLPSSVSSVM